MFIPAPRILRKDLTSVTTALLTHSSGDHHAAKPKQRTTRGQWLALAVLLAGIAWVFLPTILSLESIWRNDPDQTHGYFVVPFVIYLLWLRRHAEIEEFGAPIWGLALLAAGLGLRFFGIYIYFDWLQAAALVPCLVGIGMIVWGSTVIWKIAGPLMFLLFMIPLPYRAATALAFPLQRIATVGSTYLLETLGYFASSMGTRIHLGEHTLDVVSACSGLKILMTFFALSVAVALLQTERLWWERLAIILAAIPIAMAANIIRITMTAMLYQADIPWLAQSVYHDLAGWLMMPIALIMLAAWTWFLRLCIAVDERDVTERNFLSAAP